MEVTFGLFEDHNIDKKESLHKRETPGTSRQHIKNSINKNVS